MIDSMPAHVLLLSITAVAALTDTRTGQIPNWLTLPTLAAAPIVHAVWGLPGAWIASLLGALACAAVPATVFALSREGMGGGDVKLFAAIGALAGAYVGIEIQFYSFVAISAYALLLLTLRGRLVSALQNCGWVFLNIFLPRRRRRTIESATLTPLRLGAAIWLATIYRVMHHVELWT